MSNGGMFLGGPVGSSGERIEGRIGVDPDDLTTHGVIVGMTGSGKTGLGIIYVEEALRRGIPVLVIDPKGDMTNLLLTFPDLAPADFEPWMDELEARRKGTSVATMAADTAQLWKNGLAGWDLDGADIAALRDAADFAIFTPGSHSGTPVNLIGSLQRPTGDWDQNAEIFRDEIDSFASGLLGLVGIEADPLSSREHILVSNLIEHGWASGKNLDLPTLIAWIQRPPLRKLGVFDVDTFYPESERLDFAMALNGLIASPSFAPWAAGEPLDPDRLLGIGANRPRASILYLAHLSDAERQFVVGLALARVISWMRRQPGTGSLRALIYMDEAFGFAPPVGEPPAKKPILTILKQARAFGVGMLVSTQNPMDLDYKAMSNAGLWNIGRLQTERDKARILEGISAAAGGVDVADFDRRISALGKRQFVLHSTRESAPQLFTTRWAMSYLRGPLTLPQVGMLIPEEDRRADPEGVAIPPEPARSTPELSDDESAVMPPVAPGVEVAHVRTDAPWGDAIGMNLAGTTLEAALVATCTVRFDEARAGVDHVEKWEAVAAPLGEPFDPATLRAVDHDRRDFTADAPAGAVYRLPVGRIDSAAYFKSAGAAIKTHLDHHLTRTVFRNEPLGAFSRIGETREEFAERCRRLAGDRADDDKAALRERYESRLDTARERFEAAQRRERELEVDVSGARRTEWTDLAGTVIDFLSGRRGSGGLSGSSRRRASTRSKEQRLRTARDKSEARRDDIEDLEEDLRDDIAEIEEDWSDAAGQITELEIGLERDDIEIDRISIAWFPV